MIRIASASSSAAPIWHAVFLQMLPIIRQHARIAFRHLRAESREEAVQSVICNACAAIARLADLGKLDIAYPTVLARYGVAQVNDGRIIGGHLNCRDVSSTYCQQRKGVTVERLDHFDEEENQWEEAVVVDTRTSPVPEIVAFRCDFPEWLGTLSRRNRKIAQSLAIGNRTQDVARRFKVSEGRVSQLRKELAESWGTFLENERGPAHLQIGAYAQLLVKAGHIVMIASVRRESISQVRPPICCVGPLV